MNKKGFTLIELLAVIVILAIIALIATPIVLDIIKDSKENARERSIDNIIHAAEIAYAKHQVKGESVDFLTFDLSDKNGLEFNGERPNGTVTIYPNGKVYLNATFEDGKSYIKLPDSTSEELYTDGKVIGSSGIWDTDGKGTIEGLYGLPLELEIGIFSQYVEGAYSFATAPRVDENGNRYEEADMSIYELEPLVIEPQYRRQFLTNNTLKQEIDYLLELFNVKDALTDQEMNTLLQKNSTKIPYVIDLINLLKQDGYIDERNYINSKAYNLLKNLVDDSFLVIPNHVMNDDGTLEKITAIGDMAFVHSEWVGHNLNIVSNINNILLNKKLNDLSHKLGTETNLKGINLIISNGIEKIGTSAFSFSLLNSVKFPNTLKEIGEGSFDFVYGIDNLIFPESLETIGDAAFLLSNIEGELIIPSNVKYIGASAFSSLEGDENVGTTNININKYRNIISNIIFKPNSKIETIAEAAFMGNKVNELTIPSSIKNIGENAFYMDTLKNVIIKKQQGVDLTIGENAFGTANVSYQP